MSSKQLMLIPNEHREENSWLRYSCRVIRLNGKTQESVDELYFDRPPTDNPISTRDAEPYLIATLMTAMQEGRDLHIDGTVSQELLFNISKLQQCWSMWVDDFSRIEIIISSENIIYHPDSVRSNQAIAAYSGGVDANFTLHSHLRNFDPHRAKEIKQCFLVHGFDIPLANQEQFDVVFKRSQSTLTKLGIELTPIRTNFKAISGVHWEYCFGAAVAAVMNTFKKEASYGFIGSGQPFLNVQTAWGQNPITDPLFSSAEMRIEDDGTGYSRSEKAYYLSRWMEDPNSLRVCWEGPNKSENCGVCEKCTRTKMNFEANGITPPTTLGGKVEKQHIKKIRLDAQVKLDEYKSIIRRTEQAQARPDWLPTLKKKVIYYQAKRDLKKIIKNLIKNIKNEY